MPPNDWDDVCDERLREVLARDTYPRARGAAVTVRQRIVRRRRVRHLATGAAGVAAVLMAASAVYFVPRANRSTANGDGRAAQVAAVEASELDIAAVLFAAPPVDALDVLADQQAAYVAVLEQLD